MNNIAISTTYIVIKNKPTVYYKESIQEYQRISENIKEYREFMLSQITGSTKTLLSIHGQQTQYTQAVHTA